MFWNKKEETFRTLVEVTGKIPALRIQGFPGYKDDAMETAKRLAFYEDLQKLDVKLNLILDHLKLKYVPETETKEPAKLVDNTVSLGINWGILGKVCNPYAGTTQSVKETPKKRGRPKKK